jgi:hypothetical protein
VTDSPRFLSLRSGIHASTSDLTSTPGTLRPLELVDAPPAGLLPMARAEIDRALVKADGRGVPFVWGAKDISPLTLKFELRGVQGNDGDAVSDWEALQELGHLFQSLFAAAPATTGSAPTASGTAGATLTVSSTDIEDDEAILFGTTTGVFARRVISGGGTTTLTLDRAASGTASGPVLRGAVYTADPAQTAHLPLYLDAESTQEGGTAWRKILKGCFPQSMVISVPDTGIVMCEATFAPNDTDTTQAAADPGVLSPAAGAPIFASNVQFWDGADLLDASNLKFSYSTGGVMKPTSAGPNGVRGGVGVSKRQITLEGDLYLGSFTGEKRFAVGSTPYAQADIGDALDAGTVNTTRSLLLQVGTIGTATVAIWIPEASVRSTIVANGDFTVERFVARATGAVPAIIVIY